MLRDKLIQLLGSPFLSALLAAIALFVCIPCASAGGVTPRATALSVPVAVTEGSEGNQKKAALLNEQGNTDLKAGKYGEAVRVFEQAVTLDPSNAQWHYNYSVALSDLGDRAGQERELRMAVELNSRLVAAHNDLGLCYLSDGKLSEAEEQFRTALGINPKSAEAQNDLGILYAREGNAAKAAAMFQQATANNPHYARAFFNWGIMRAGDGEFFQASALFERAIQLSPKFADAYIALAETTAKEGHKNEAIPIFRKALKLQPDSPTAHLNLGIALADTQQLKEAFAEFQEAARLDPKYAPAYYNQARVQSTLDQIGLARQNLETACRLDPDYPAAIYLLALIERKSHHLQRSTELLQQVVTLTPHDSDAQYELGRNLQDLGRRQDAIQHWRFALKADPDNTKVLYNLAQALGRTDSKEAKIYMSRFQALQQQQILADRIRTLGNFGLSAADEQHWTQAVSDFQQALRICGDCPQRERLHKDLGLIYSRKGDVADAERELRAALKLNPNDGDALKAMQILQAPGTEPGGAQ